jgi:glycosyltransferase involved in cell wall biosynthesis
MISLVLCSYNGLDRIPSTLESLSKLHIPNNVELELIFVDSNSSQPMCLQVQKCWQQFGAPFELITLTQNKQGKVAALQLGFKQAKGEYFVIVDDDNELQFDYLEKGCNYLQQFPQVGVLGGQGILPVDYISPTWFEKYAYYFACGPQNDREGEVRPNRNVVYGAGMWVRSEAYQKALQNGFSFIFDFHASNQSVKTLNNGGEDGELCWAIRFQGFEIHYLGSLVFTHRISPSKFTDSYLKLIKERTDRSTLLGSLYFRVSLMEKEKVTNFWIKELFFILIFYFKNFKLNKSYFTTELIRNWSNILLLFKMRKKYDNLVNNVLNFKSKSL